jgi:hypothetical protein
LGCKHDRFAGRFNRAAAGRIEVTWYAWTQLTIDLPFSGSGPYQVAVYCLDWDGGGSRWETLQILDVNNNVLDTRSIANFAGGVWVVWSHWSRTARVTSTGAINAVISGIFFGTAGTAIPATAQFVKVDTTTQGTWKGVYLADGYNVIGNTPSYPGTWLRRSAEIPCTRRYEYDRFARVAADWVGPGCSNWYSGTQFTIDLPFNGSGPYQMAVYCLDWD